MYLSSLKRRILFSFVCILGCIWNANLLVAQTTPSSQNRVDREAADTYFAQAKTALQNRDTETALPLIHKADSLYQKLALPQEVIETKMLEYRCFNFSKPISEWSTPLYQALSFEKKLEKPSMTKVKLFAALSTNANINNQPTVSSYYGSKALSLLQGEHLIKAPEYQAFYMSILYRMGKVEEFQYNYKKAENFYNQSLEKARKHELPFYLSYGGLFKTYTLTNQHEKIIEMVEEFEAENYAQSQPSFFVYDFYSYHIDYLIKNSLYDKAMKQSLALKKLRNTDKFKAHFSEWFLSERIADIYSYQGNHQEAINELLSTKALQESLEIRNIERAALLIKLAKYYLDLNDYKNAQYYSEEALTVNTGIQRNTTTFHMPLDLENIEKAHKNILLDNLLFKAQLAQELYTETKNNNYLKTKKQSYITAHELIKRMGKLSDEDAFLNETQFKNVYGNLMQLYQQEWQANKDQKTFDSALQLRLQSQYVTILNELKDAQQHKDIDSIPFIKNSRTTYEGYNKVYYFWGQKAIYVLHENNTTQHFDNILLTPELKEAIDIVSAEVRKKDTPRNNKAHQLIYEKLLKKYIQSDPKTAVLLDDKLHLIPMSSLWIAAEKQYLLDKTSMIHITTALPIKETSRSEKALLMAPFATQDGIFNNRLAKSFDEINAIAPYFDHTTYVDQQATKNVFLDQLTNSSIIHLATHAIANAEDPLLSTIQFYEEEALDPAKISLTLPEIYDLNLNADLVTLSACETGIGKEIKGKGVQSMANAFTHAGASSTVMSLWKVPDTETTMIMTSFYTYLHEGMSKDEALRKAKLAYLDAQRYYPTLQHPYYWSGFIISGNPTAIKQQDQPWKKWIFIAIGIFLLLFLLLFRKPLFQQFQ
ncbi:CHAT domain-containing tetratricopeptide repeat protein [uncultured Dokdonia sp.]|uniref:CHAT domain-containing protein n=1 Tax=uncultured Dokdonia sp. TaxID=575653 RepID=UPI0026040D73|nr:CHAT domain-containing tetratricopeptide repeat protein [uncultured Dokdonia sp.]